MFYQWLCSQCSILCKTLQGMLQLIRNILIQFLCLSEIVHVHSLSQIMSTRVYLWWGLVPCPRSLRLHVLSQAATFSSFSYFFWHLPPLFLNDMQILIFFFFYFKDYSLISCCRRWRLAFLNPPTPQYKHASSPHLFLISYITILT